MAVVARIWEEGRMNKQSTEEFQGGETTLYDNTMMDMGHYPLVKIHSMYSTKSDL